MNLDFTVLLESGLIVVNRGQNRECITEAFERHLYTWHVHMFIDWDTKADDKQIIW